MENINYSHIDFLNSIFSQKQRGNPNYSLRSFARNLGMHPATLSLVLRGKRQLPKKNLERILNVLKLSPIQEVLFKESFYKAKTKLDNIKISSTLSERTILDDTYYNILAEWEHYALLRLIETSDCQHSDSFFAKRLGVSQHRIQVVLQELKKAKLIKFEEGKYFSSKGPLRTTEDISSRALQKSHQETLDIAKQKLEEVEVELRDFSSMTVAVDPEKIPEAKTIIREFRQKMATLLRDGNKKEVYQMAIQLFPLTQNSNNN